MELDPTWSQFAYFLGSEILQQQQARPERLPEALFYFARAAAYNGPNAMAEASRRTAEDYLARAYTAYHGSDEGMDDLLAMAKANPFPPVGFTVLSAAEVSRVRPEQESRQFVGVLLARDAASPTPRVEPRHAAGANSNPLVRIARHLCIWLGSISRRAIGA